MYPKDEEGMLNIVDWSDSPSGAVWSGSTLFAQICLSQYLGQIKICVFTVMGLKILGRVETTFFIYHFYTETERINLPKCIKFCIPRNPEKKS